MGQYQKHSNSKKARKDHKKREKKRKKKLNGLAAFFYSDSRGKSKKFLSKTMGQLH